MWSFISGAAADIGIVSLDLLFWFFSSHFSRSSLFLVLSFDYLS